MQERGEAVCAGVTRLNRLMQDRGEAVCAGVTQLNRLMQERGEAVCAGVIRLNRLMQERDEAGMKQVFAALSTAQIVSPGMDIWTKKAIYHHT